MVGPVPRRMVRGHLRAPQREDLSSGSFCWSLLLCEPTRKTVWSSSVKMRVSLSFDMVFLACSTPSLLAIYLAVPPGRVTAEFGWLAAFAHHRQEREFRRYVRRHKSQRFRQLHHRDVSHFHVLLQLPHRCGCKCRSSWGSSPQR